MTTLFARLRRALLLLCCAPLFTACCFSYGYGYGHCGTPYHACHPYPHCR